MLKDAVVKTVQIAVGAAVGIMMSEGMNALVVKPIQKVIDSKKGGA